MNTRWSDILSETLGAAVGTTIGVVAVGYGFFELITNSLDVVF